MRLFPKQKWRLLLFVLVSFYFLPFGWWKDQTKGVWALVRHARVHDDAGVLSLSDEWHFERFLMHIYEESGVDIRFVFVPSLRGQSLEDFSVRKARELGVGRDVDRRGLLIVYDVAAHDLRIEVGPQLEGVITDAFAGFLMRNHVRSFFGTGNPSLGLRTTLFMVHDRIRRAVLGQDFDPRNVQYIEDTRRLALGGGASADMQIAASAAFLNRERTSDRATRTRFAPQPTPEAAYQRYLEWDARGQYETDVPLFTPLSQEYLATLPMTPGYNDYYRSVEYAQPYQIMERGDLALLYFTADPLASPLFFRRVPTGWTIDIIAEVLNTRNYEGGSWTWGLLDTGDDFTRTFGDQYVVVGPILRLAGGDNRPLPSMDGPAVVSVPAARQPAAVPQGVLEELSVAEAAQRTASAGRPAMVLLYATGDRYNRANFPDLMKLVARCRAAGAKILAFSVDQDAVSVRELPAFIGMERAPFSPVRLLAWQPGQLISALAPLGIEIESTWDIPLVAVRTAGDRVVKAEGAEQLAGLADSLLQACATTTLSQVPRP